MSQAFGPGIYPGRQLRCLRGSYSNFFAVAKKSEKNKGKKKKWKGNKVNKEEGKSLLYGISAAAGMTTKKYASAGRLSKRVRDTASSWLLSLLSDAYSAALLERIEGRERESSRGDIWADLIQP